MKLVIVSPPFGEKGQKSKGLPIAPPVLEYMAGLTRQLRPEIEGAVGQRRPRLRHVEPAGVAHHRVAAVDGPGVERLHLGHRIEHHLADRGIAQVAGQHGVAALRFMSRYDSGHAGREQDQAQRGFLCDLSCGKTHGDSGMSRVPWPAASPGDAYTFPELRRMSRCGTQSEQITDRAEPAFMTAT